jgi:hypothetical protein
VGANKLLAVLLGEPGGALLPPPLLRACPTPLLLPQDAAGAQVHLLPSGKSGLLSLCHCQKLLELLLSTWQVKVFATLAFFALCKRLKQAQSVTLGL